MVQASSQEHRRKFLIFTFVFSLQPNLAKLCYGSLPLNLAITQNCKKRKLLRFSILCTSISYYPKIQDTIIKITKLSMKVLKKIQYQACMIYFLKFNVNTQVGGLKDTKGRQFQAKTITMLKVITTFITFFYGIKFQANNLHFFIIIKQSKFKQTVKM